MIQDPAGSGSTNPSTGAYSYASGTNIQVIATPAYGWVLDHWALDGTNANSSNPLTVSMNGNHILKASFKNTTQYTLMIQDPAGSGSTNPSTGAYSYASGTNIQVIATPAYGWVLDHWALDGTNANSSNPLTMTMDSDHTLKASFKNNNSTRVYTENAVWIQDLGNVYMQKNILSTNLTKVINDLKNNHIKYAFVKVGYWRLDSNNMPYIAYNDLHDEAFYADLIQQMHAVNVKVIAWVEDTPGVLMDLTTSTSRQSIYDVVVNCMNKGFDGYNDDIETYRGTQQDLINYLNGLTPIMHGLIDPSNPQGKLNMPDTPTDFQQNLNQYLKVDYIVSMFYSNISRFEDTTDGQSFFQENFGEYLGHNSTPASPLILGIMNNMPPDGDGNTHPLSWQFEQLNTYLSEYGHHNLVGFSLWLYEYMGTTPTDWADWNTWITNGSQ